MQVNRFENTVLCFLYTFTNCVFSLFNNKVYVEDCSTCSSWSTEASGVVEEARVDDVDVELTIEFLNSSAWHKSISSQLLLTTSLKVSLFSF